MKLVNREIDPLLYARSYSKSNLTSTSYLPYRDLPKILEEYVTGKDAIDYGCGSGKSSLFLKSLGFNTVGLDINSEMIEISKQRDPQGDYRKIESAKIPFEDKCCDLVLSCFVLFEIPSRDEVAKVMKEVHRVLRKGGKYIFVVDNENTYKYNWLSLNTDFEENKNIRSGSRVKVYFKELDFSTYDYYWTDEVYRNLLKESGFELLKIHNPLGTKTDGYNWIDEEKKAPLSIYISEKKY